MEEPFDVVTLTVSPAPGRTKVVDMPVDGAVVMGMRGRVAEHYRVASEDFQPHATSLDYLIGAAAACLTGTFSGLLNHLGQSVEPDSFSATAEGSLVKERGVLRVSAVRVDYSMSLTDGIDAAEVRRLHDLHPSRCPVARSLAGAVELATTLELR